MSEEIEDRIEVNFLGRNLGTASGWDGEPGEIIWFYDFIPRDGIKLAQGQLVIDTIKGYIGAIDDEGEFTKESAKDIVEFLGKVPRNV